MGAYKADKKRFLPEYIKVNKNWAAQLQTTIEYFHHRAKPNHTL